MRVLLTLPLIAFAAAVCGQNTVGKQTVVPPEGMGVGGVLELQVTASPFDPLAPPPAVNRQAVVGPPVASGPVRPDPIEVTVDAWPMGTGPSTAPVPKTTVGGPSQTTQPGEVIEMTISATPLGPRKPVVGVEPE